MYVCTFRHGFAPARRVPIEAPASVAACPGLPVVTAPILDCTEFSCPKLENSPVSIKLRADGTGPWKA